jgi:hypothetical protein
MDTDRYAAGGPADKAHIPIVDDSLTVRMDPLQTFDPAEYEVEPAAAQFMIAIEERS